MYEGEEYGFFNFGRNDNGAFIDTVNKMDAFFTELGYISAQNPSLNNLNVHYRFAIKNYQYAKWVTFIQSAMSKCNKKNISK